jgi:putative aldouronate transport system permease protein
MNIAQNSIPAPVTRHKPKWLMTVLRNLDLYLLLLPGVAFILIFKYVPMYGLSIAFEKYSIFKGVTGSQWVGFDQFRRLFSSPQFYQIFGNTLMISLYKIVFIFPIPILIAVILNEIRQMAYKRVIQTVIYLPHFLSWVIVSGLVIEFLSPSTGMVNHLFTMFGGKPISFLMDNHWFRSVAVISAGWKEVGYSAIIYIASIAGIDQEQYEAARVDGASRIRQIMHITLPGLWSIILLMFILRLGSVLEAGTEQILLLYNPTVYPSGDVIGTFVYRTGITQMDYGYSTAVGLFESVIGFILVISGNFISKKSTGRSIW